MLRGREGELERFRSVLDRVAEGSDGGAVVVEGGAGMGKTTFLAAALRHAGAQGFAVLEARGHALGAGVAYGPVAAALGRYLHGLAGDDRARLTTGLASLARLVEGIGEPAAPADPDLERSRLYQAVALLLGRIGAQRPVVLSVDDLHWADAASVELLEYLTDELGREQLVVVAAYRPGDAAGRPDVQHLVATLLRLPAAARIEIGPLARPHLAHLVVDRLGGPASPQLLDELADRTGGVALAVDAVLRSLADAGALVDAPEGWTATAPVEVPEYVVELFAQRLRALPDDARAAVAAIAVADEPLATRDLGTAVELDEQAALAAVERAMAAGLLRAVSPDAFDVAHPLVADAAREVLTESERRRLHRAFAAALATAGDAALDRHARHVVGAGSLVPDDDAARVLGRAGRRALNRGAWDAAARWLSAAAVRARSAALPPPEIGELLRAAAGAWERRYELDAAVAAHAEAMDLLAPVDPGAAALAGIAAARLTWQLGRSDADGWTARALALAAEAPPAARLRIHFEHLGAITRQGRVAEAPDAIAKLRADVDAAPAGTMAEVARYRITAIEVFLGTRAAEALLEQVPSLPADAPLDVVVNVAGPVLDALVTLGRWDDALRRADELLAAIGPDAAVTGLSWRAVSARILAAFATGRWGDAADLLTELGGHAAAVRASRAFWSGVLQVHSGEVDAAREAVAVARREVARAVLGPQASALDVLLAYIDFIGGEPARATPALTQRAPFNAMSHVLVSSMVGELLAAAGSHAEARAEAAGLRVRGGAGSLAQVAADRLDALIDDDGPALRVAARGYEALGMPFEAARASVEAAERGAGGVDLLDVHRRLQRLGARPWEARAGALAGAVVEPAPPRDPLTPRERQVATLVADGLTNAQIAERLAVSIRTVTSHLDHVYTKLGIGSRTALASYVLRDQARLGSPT